MRGSGPANPKRRRATLDGSKCRFGGIATLRLGGLFEGLWLSSCLVFGNCELWNFGWLDELDFPGEVNIIGDGQQVSLHSAENLRSIILCAEVLQAASLQEA